MNTPSVMYYINFKNVAYMNGNTFFFKLLWPKKAKPENISILNNYVQDIFSLKVSKQVDFLLSIDIPEKHFYFISFHKGMIAMN